MCLFACTNVMLCVNEEKTQYKYNFNWKKIYQKSDTIFCFSPNSFSSIIFAWSYPISNL